MGFTDSVQVTIKSGKTSAPATYQSVILRTNDPLVFSDRDTKYIIKWDFDLEGKTIILPPNVLLEFDGGSLSNGTIVGDNTTIIQYQEDDKIFNNVTLNGTYKYTLYRGPELKVLTEDEYEALETYSDNTIYFVKE